MALEVKLGAFEGPLDLLLHLIEKNKVDIYDIPIVEITNQYLEYIKALETENMDVMSEFLVMAATLVDIKCRMLLPAEVNEEGEEEDPRAELVQKLLEYKMYKYMSFELKDMQMDNGFSLCKKETLPEDVKNFREPINYEELIGDMNLNKLHEIFNFMMQRKVDKIDPIRSNYGNIQKEVVDMEQKAIYIENYIRMNKTLSFVDLLERQNSKTEIIVTFLVVLELMKTGVITIVQNDLFDDITISSLAA